MTKARCARCNRVLKDPKSIAAGVGPTCAGKLPRPGVTAGGNGSRPAEDRVVVEFVPPAPAPATGACTIVETEDQMIHVPLSRIDPNPWQTRRGFDDDYVNELAADIEGRKASRPATLGLLQTPAGRLVDADGERVTPQSDNWVAQRIQEDGYRVQLVYGHNRFEAFKRLAGTDADYGLMPLSIVAFGDEEMATSAWAENAQRKDLSPVEEAWAIQRMMDSFDWTQEQVGQQLGMGRSTVANKTRLLKLPEDVQGAIHDGRISERQGIAFLPALDIKPHEMDGAHLAKNADFGYWQAPTPNALRQRLVEKGDLTADQVRTAVEKTKAAVERAKKDRWEREQRQAAEPPAPSAPARTPSPPPAKTGSASTRLTELTPRDIEKLDMPAKDEIAPPTVVVNIRISQAAGNGHGPSPTDFSLSIGEAGAFPRFFKGDYADLVQTLDSALTQFFAPPQQETLLEMEVERE